MWPYPQRRDKMDVQFSVVGQFEKKVRLHPATHAIIKQAACHRDPGEGAGNAPRPAYGDRLRIVWTAMSQLLAPHPTVGQSGRRTAFRGIA